MNKLLIKFVLLAQLFNLVFVPLAPTIALADHCSIFGIFDYSCHEEATETYNPDEYIPERPEDERDDAVDQPEPEPEPQPEPQPEPEQPFQYNFCDDHYYEEGCPGYVVTPADTAPSGGTQEPGDNTDPERCLYDYYSEGCPGYWEAIEAAERERQNAEDERLAREAEAQQERQRQAASEAAERARQQAEEDRIRLAEEESARRQSEEAERARQQAEEDRLYEETERARQRAEEDARILEEQRRAEEEAQRVAQQAALDNLRAEEEAIAASQRAAEESRLAQGLVDQRSGERETGNVTQKVGDSCAGGKGTIQPNGSCYIRPDYSPTSSGQVVINSCLKEVCDTNLNRLVCIEEVFDPIDGNKFTKSGSLTDKSCNLDPGIELAAPVAQRLDDCSSTVCSESGFRVCIERWREIDGRISPRQGVVTNERCGALDVRVAQGSPITPNICPAGYSETSPGECYNAQGRSFNFTTGCESGKAKDSFGICRVPQPDLPTWGTACEIFGEDSSECQSGRPIPTPTTVPITPTPVVVVVSATPTPTQADIKVTVGSECTKSDGTKGVTDNKGVCLDQGSTNIGRACTTESGVSGTYQNLNGSTTCMPSVAPPELVIIPDGAKRDAAKKLALSSRQGLPFGRIGLSADGISEDLKQDIENACKGQITNGISREDCMSFFDLDKVVINDDQEAIAKFRELQTNGELTLEESEALNKYLAAIEDINVQTNQNRVNYGTTSLLGAGALVAAPAVATAALGAVGNFTLTSAASLLGRIGIDVGAGYLVGLAGEGVAANICDRFSLDERWCRATGSLAGDVTGGVVTDIAVNRVARTVTSRSASSTIVRLSEEVIVAERMLANATDDISRRNAQQILDVAQANLNKAEAEAVAQGVIQAPDEVVINPAADGGNQYAWYDPRRYDPRRLFGGTTADPPSITLTNPEVRVIYDEYGTPIPVVLRSDSPVAITDNAPVNPLAQQSVPAGSIIDPEPELSAPSLWDRFRNLFGRGSGQADNLPAGSQVDPPAAATADSSVTSNQAAPSVATNPNPPKKSWWERLWPEPEERYDVDQFTVTPRRDPDVPNAGTANGNFDAEGNPIPANGQAVVPQQAAPNPVDNAAPAAQPAAPQAAAPDSANNPIPLVQQSDPAVSVTDPEPVQPDPSLWDRIRGLLGRGTREVTTPVNPSVQQIIGVETGRGALDFTKRVDGRWGNHQVGDGVGGDAAPWYMSPQHTPEVRDSSKIIRLTQENVAGLKDEGIYNYVISSDGQILLGREADNLKHFTLAGEVWGVAKNGVPHSALKDPSLIKFPDKTIVRSGELRVIKNSDGTIELWVDLESGTFSAYGLHSGQPGVGWSKDPTNFAKLEDVFQSLTGVRPKGVSLVNPNSPGFNTGTLAKELVEAERRAAAKQVSQISTTNDVPVTTNQSLGPIPPQPEPKQWWEFWKADPDPTLPVPPAPVRGVQTVDELIATLPDSIKGSQQTYTKRELEIIIKDIRDGKTNVDKLTNTGDLRNTLIDLLNKEGKIIDPITRLAVVKPQVIANAINSSKNLDELFDALPGAVQDNSRIYTKDELVAIISAVKKGELDIDNVTTTGDIRKKVVSILRSEGRDLNPFTGFVNSPNSPTDNLIRLGTPQAAARAGEVPRLVDAVDLNLGSRTENVNINPRRVFGYSGPKTVFTEGEAITNMDQFLKTIEDGLRSKGLTNQADEVRAFRENMIFIGKDQYDSAISAMAKRVEDLSQDGPVIIYVKEGFTRNISGDISDGASDVFIANKVIQEYERLTGGKGSKYPVFVSQSSVDTAEALKRYGPGRAKALLFDDVVLSGQQMGDAMENLVYSLVNDHGFTRGQALSMMEANVMATTFDHKLVVEQGKDVRAQFLAKPYKTADAQSQISAASIYSDTDYGWRNTIDIFVNNYNTAVLGVTNPNKGIAYPILYRMNKPYKPGHPDLDEVVRVYEQILENYKLDKSLAKAS